MNDIIVAKIFAPDQDVVVLAGNDYVALELSYPESDQCEEHKEPDEVVLLAPAGAERLADALGNAALKAREVAQFVAAVTGGSL
jgi:hypothetical protein